jgi:hypothetical protein
MVFAFEDNGDRRALSLASAVADVLGLKREEAIYRHGAAEGWAASKDTEPPNRHVYRLAKQGLHLVVNPLPHTRLVGD